MTAIVTRGKKGFFPTWVVGWRICMHTLYRQKSKEWFEGEKKEHRRQSEEWRGMNLHVSRGFDMSEHGSNFTNIYMCGICNTYKLILALLTVMVWISIHPPERTVYHSIRWKGLKWKRTKKGRTFKASFRRMSTRPRIMKWKSQVGCIHVYVCVHNTETIIMIVLELNIPFDEKILSLISPIQNSISHMLLHNLFFLFIYRKWKGSNCPSRTLRR